MVFIPSPVFAGTYGGGSGEPNDPYLIYTPQQLNEIGATPADWAKCFKLMADIDPNTNPNYFNRIGTDPNYPFTGAFDGNNHTISNFTYKAPTTDYIGLFGSVGSGGQIKNLGLTNVNVEGKYYTGGLVGWNYGTITNCYANGSVISSGDYSGCTGSLVGYSRGTITNCYADGEVTGTSYTGGLVGYNWGPITNSYATGTVTGYYYTGGLAGRNYYGTITNCYATGTVTGYYYTGGLVGFNDKYGTITNCYATGSVAGHFETGGLAGRNQDGTITNSYAAGSVTSSGSYTGGLVGINYGTITNCYAEGSVTGGDYTGGLVGCNSGTISNSYAAGSVTGDDETGGLVGYNYYGAITNSYAAGSVTGSSYYTGGLVGDNSNGAITNSYAAGSVTGSSYTGGLVGYGGGVVNSFWDIETTGQSTSAGGIGKTTAEMHQAATFFCWNSCGEVAWTIDEGNDYPRLIWQGLPGIPIPSYQLTDFLAGSGTTQDPYLIYTPDQLNTIGLFPCERNKRFKLMADIDLAAYTGVEFNLIGTGPAKPFTGTFDGNNHIISNFTYTSTTTDYVGLFGCLGSGGQIKDLGLTNVNVTGWNYTGGLVVWNYGTIINSYASGSVTGDSYTGGLVGYNSGTVTNSYTNGSVTGGRFTGGLVGYNYGTITKSYATGSVTGSGDCTGGLVGYNIQGTITKSYATGSVTNSGDDTGGLVGSNGSGTITNSYATGNVTGLYDYTGGLVGSNGSDWSGGGTITNCYATGKVTGSSYTGGLVGRKYSGTITASFWDTETTGQTTSAGGVGKTTVQMKTKSTFTSAGWDFVNVWTIRETTNYPRLLWQVSAADFMCPDGVNFIDYAYFANRWLEINCSSSGNCGGTDLDLSGTVDIADLAIFALDWLYLYAEYNWTEPALLPELNDASGNAANVPCLSRDGLTIYFQRQIPGLGHQCIVQAGRDTPDGPFTSERVLTELCTTGGNVATPWVSDDGLRLYYREDDGGISKIKMTQCSDVNQPWTPVKTFDELHQGGADGGRPTLTADELIIVFASNRPGSAGDADLWTAWRSSLDALFSSLRPLDELNSPLGESRPCISPDGLTLYFDSTRDDGPPAFEIYKATRSSINQPFGNVQRYEPIRSQTYDQKAPYVTPDEKAIYCYSERGSEKGIWVSRKVKKTVPCLPQ